MYSLVMMAAMTAGPDVPQNWMCPVTPSKYGNAFWSKHCFYECCAPARYGWVECWNKGFSYYPGNARSFCGDCGCPTNFGQFYRPSACDCAPCGGGFGGGGYGGHTWCGCGWSVGDQPAYYTSVLGCPPCVSGPPYARCTDKNPCCHTMSLAFDTGLAGHSHGVGYSGFGGYGNFGFYGGVPMMHRPSTLDLPPFPRPDRFTAAIPAGPAPMPPLPMSTIPLPPPKPELPAEPSPELKKDQPKKEEPKKSQTQRPARATVVLSVPDGASVSVEGQPLLSSGRERTFRTPELPTGQEFVYTVRAVILVAGHEEIETLKVTVLAGEVSRASFEQLFAKVERPGRSLTSAGR
jgi:uncharacterized protein (TIGR03000 family)